MKNIINIFWRIKVICNYLFLLLFFFSCTKCFCSETINDLFSINIKGRSKEDMEIKIKELERTPLTSKVKIYVTNRGTYIGTMVSAKCGYASLAKHRGYRYFVILENKILYNCKNYEWCEETNIGFLKDNKDDIKERFKGIGSDTENKRINIVDVNNIALACGFTPIPDKELHYSVFKGDIEKVEKFILQQTKNLNEKDKWNFTPLHIAVAEGHLKIVKLLLANNVKVNEKGPWEQTALHIAVYDEPGDPEMVKAILNKKPDVNIKMIGGKTPLHIAVLKENINFIKQLIDAGANKDETDDSSKTPLQYAKEKGNKKIIKSLNKRKR